MDDLELLLSFGDDAAAAHSGMTDVASLSGACLDRPDAFPAAKSGYCSDEERPASRPLPNMSVFKDALKGDASKLFTSALPAKASQLQQPQGKSPCVGLEARSGLRIKNECVNSTLLNEKLSGLRFLQLQALRVAMIGDVVKGDWATMGVLAEKAPPRVASNGKNYGIWKLTSLDSTTISLFLFGDAYREHWKESVGSVVAVFGANTRSDKKKNDFSLSIFAVEQLTVVGTSVDFTVCNGSRKDGTPCTVVLDRRNGLACKFHSSGPPQNKFRSNRPELNGGKFSATPGRCRPSPNPTVPTRSVIEELTEIETFKRQRIHSPAEITKLLSNPEKLTSRVSSQGLRLLASLTTEGSKAQSKDGAKKQTLVADASKAQSKDGAKKQTLERNGKRKAEARKATRPALAEMPNGAATQVMELDLEGHDDEMIQAMSIFNKKKL